MSSGYLCAGSDVSRYCPGESMSSVLSPREEKHSVCLKILKPSVNQGVGADGVEKVCRNVMVNRERAVAFKE